MAKGSLDYQYSQVSLQAVIDKLAKVGQIPTHYFYPELLVKPE